MRRVHAGGRHRVARLIAFIKARPEAERGQYHGRGRGRVGGLGQSPKRKQGEAAEAPRPGPRENRGETDVHPMVGWGS